MVKRVEVAAGVILRGDGAFLLGRRAPGTFYPGYWEFPGGKVEAGEAPADALRRELEEELGIRAIELRPWIVRRHDYEHARVSLHFFEVARWEGEVRDHVHDALAWQFAGAAEVAPMLPANGPVMKALRLPRFMGITHAGEIGVAAQLEGLERALGGGLRLVQVRESTLAVDDLREFVAAVIERARPHGALVVVNGEARVARAAAADGVHLKSAELATMTARPDFEWVGASCHSREEVEHAGRLGLDYALLGPVQATLTHPGVEGIGWQRFAELAADLPMPVFGLGGLSAADMDEARAAGAHGIATIRSAWPR
ncbi:Nudix family hydrolase [Pseudazoarcus pumilus]|uniref:8-oxo-dGTP diphosphatase n=1 Tax=Pseudazoarcus pumilus TaxID=2067960 RepID=A0A2I6S4V8_9RHOO|nr:Nudix family hydrolase [Pseudazoarcus pumilus]AUN94295.1 DNA mismatch repair protein MutT [Pseudazoarcus pumilus]